GESPARIRSAGLPAAKPNASSLAPRQDHRPDSLSEYPAPPHAQPIHSSWVTKTSWVELGLRSCRSTTEELRAICSSGWFHFRERLWFSWSANSAVPKCCDASRILTGFRRLVASWASTGIRAASPLPCAAH